MPAPKVGALVLARVISTTTRICEFCTEMSPLLELELVLADTSKSESVRTLKHSRATLCVNCMIRSDNYGRIRLDVMGPISVPVTLTDVMGPVPISTRRAKMKRAQKQEREGAESLGGRRCAASGAGEEKGDFRNETWTGDAKGTSGKSYNLTRATSAKIAAQAAQSGRRGVLKIVVDGAELAVMNWSDFSEAVGTQNDS